MPVVGWRLHWLACLTHQTNKTRRDPPGFDALESPLAPRKQRIRHFRRAKGDTFFPLGA